MESLKGAGAGVPLLNLHSGTPADYMRCIDVEYARGALTDSERDLLLVVYRKAFDLHKERPTEPLALTILKVKSEMFGEKVSEEHLRGKLGYAAKTFDKKRDATPNADNKKVREISKATVQRVLAKESNTCAGPGCTVTDMECRHANPEKRGLQLCGRCRAISYCSVTCQTKHWKAGHKAECKPKEG